MPTDYDVRSPESHDDFVVSKVSLSSTSDNTQQSSHHSSHFPKHPDEETTDESLSVAELGATSGQISQRRGQVGSPKTPSNPIHTLNLDSVISSQDSSPLIHERVMVQSPSQLYQNDSESSSDSESSIKPQTVQKKPPKKQKSRTDRSSNHSEHQPKSSHRESIDTLLSAFSLRASCTPNEIISTVQKELDTLRETIERERENTQHHRDDTFNSSFAKTRSSLINQFQNTKSSQKGNGNTLVDRLEERLEEKTAEACIYSECLKKMEEKYEDMEQTISQATQEMNRKEQALKEEIRQLKKRTREEDKLHESYQSEASELKNRYKSEQQKRKEMESKLKELESTLDRERKEKDEIARLIVQRAEGRGEQKAETFFNQSEGEVEEPPQSRDRSHRRKSRKERHHAKRERSQSASEESEPEQPEHHRYGPRSSDGQHGRPSHRVMQEDEVFTLEDSPKKTTHNTEKQRKHTHKQKHKSPPPSSKRTSSPPSKLPKTERREEPESTKKKKKQKPDQETSSPKKEKTTRRSHPKKTTDRESDPTPKETRKRKKSETTAQSHHSPERTHRSSNTRQTQPAPSKRSQNTARSGEEFTQPSRTPTHTGRSLGDEPATPKIKLSSTQSTQPDHAHPAFTNRSTISPLSTRRTHRQTDVTQSEQHLCSVLGFISTLAPNNQLQIQSLNHAFISIVCDIDNVPQMSPQTQTIFVSFLNSLLMTDAPLSTVPDPLATMPSFIEAAEEVAESESDEFARIGPRITHVVVSMALRILNQPKIDRTYDDTTTLVLATFALLRLIPLFIDPFSDEHPQFAKLSQLLTSQQASLSEVRNNQDRCGLACFAILQTVMSEMNGDAFKELFLVNNGLTFVTPYLLSLNPLIAQYASFFLLLLTQSTSSGIPSFMTTHVSEGAAINAYISALRTPWIQVFLFRALRRHCRRLPRPNGKNENTEQPMFLTQSPSRGFMQSQVSQTPISHPRKKKEIELNLVYTQTTLNIAVLIERTHSPDMPLPHEPTSHAFVDVISDCIWKEQAIYESTSVLLMNEHSFTGLVTNDKSVVTEKQQSLTRQLIDLIAILLSTLKRVYDRLQIE
ncbi:hypothetical protein BLNAU_10821 [Blattamonas nauphoetae]|uniref:Uncharacterized protein n=1 Tax=Blattamonas nauphoetae TaxID=2049346 RepID=A0ABQ9XRI9_9EUKA|nr:hypothetical protein BLNAU_10821 [Blattamonas nauphoetae]